MVRTPLAIAILVAVTRTATATTLEVRPAVDGLAPTVGLSLVRYF